VPDTIVHRQTPANGAVSAAPRRGAGYAVYDPVGQKIGSVGEVFVNREGQPQYVRVRIGFFWSRSVLIPAQFVETDEGKRTLTLK
jgi:hypothetical protein